MWTRQIRKAVFRAGTQGEAKHKARPAETLICHWVSGSGWNTFRLLHGVRLVAETRTGLNWREQLQKTAEGRDPSRESSGGHQARYALGLLLPLLHNATGFDYPQLIEQWSSVLFPPGDIYHRLSGQILTIMKQLWTCVCHRSLLSKNVMSSRHNTFMTGHQKFILNVYVLDSVPTGKPAISLKWKVLRSSKHRAFPLEGPVSLME